MIKRPLGWVMGAYLAGMSLAWYKIFIVFAFLLMLLSYIIIYYLMFRTKKALINQRDSFLWFLPLLLLLGFYTMQGQMERPELDQAFEEKAQCELSGRITMIVEKQWGRAFYVTDNTVYLSGEEPYLSENVIVYCTDKLNYLVGNQITVYGEIQKFSEAANPGQFNEKMYYQIENIDYKVKADKIIITDAGYSKFEAVLSNIKQKLMRVYNTTLPEKESGVLIAMILGENYLLDEEIKQLYQENGISHILSISGLHVSLLGLFIFKLFKKLKVPLIPATLFTILFIYSYGLLTNFSISTNRAVVMIILFLLSSLFGKTYDMLSATELSAFLILIKNPMQIFNIGFLLSYSAILGIAVLLPCLQKLFSSKKPLLNGLLVSVSAQIMTMPMVLSFFYQLPVYSVFINLLILPCASILIITALFAGIIGTLSIPLGVFLMGGANYILKLYEGICRLGSNLPGNLITIGKPGQLSIILSFILIFIFVWGVKRYNRKIFILVLLAAFFLPMIPKGNHGLEITMLDVGQGEAIFMKTNKGTTFLIDGGSSDVSKVGVYRLQPFLLSSGIDKIDYAIVTHTDVDHVSGLKELLVGDRITIKNLVLPKVSIKDESYEEMKTLASDVGVNVLYIETGDILQEGEFKMRCLHPNSDYQASSINAYSTVLSITYGEFDMLLTGDLEKDGEERLIELFQEQTIPLPVTDYDVLKVAHHGSKYSTFLDFLQIIQPEVSLISCGKDNFYGHPHKELLERLKQAESDIKITYESGAITIKTDGKTMEVSEYMNH